MWMGEALRFGALIMVIASAVGTVTRRVLDSAPDGAA